MSENGSRQDTVTTKAKSEIGLYEIPLTESHIEIALQYDLAQILTAARI